MADDNAQKRALVNRALLIFSGAKTPKGRIFFTEITDDDFSDPFTNVSGNDEAKLAACVSYEPVLKRVFTELQPKFARQYADLGAEIRINKEIADWSYLFELPSDYFDIVTQVSQANRKTKIESKVLTFNEYAHIVNGTDDQTYYCSTAHTGASEYKPITGASYADKWSLYDADKIGVDYVIGWSYKASQSGKLLVTNEYSNDPSTTVDGDIDSAYIQYIPYVQAGINDKPEYYPEHFANAFCTRLGAEIASAIGKGYERRRELLQEYDMIAKPDFWGIQQAKEHIEERTTILEARTR